jgi:cyclohexadienyl dehydratase
MLLPLCLSRAAAIFLPALLAAASALSQPATLPGSGVLARMAAKQALRVCIWPDYYGVSYLSPRTQTLMGIDIDLAREFAKDLGVQAEFVDASFASLVEDLTHERCDIAMFAVGATPERQRVLRFSAPYLQSGIYAITTRASRNVKRWSDIDQAGVKVAVQAGTYMEPIIGAWLKKASLVVVRAPQTREQELEAGRVDVFMTDYPYSRRLLDNADWARLVAPPTPFAVQAYAYAVKPGDEAWLKRVNAFVLKIKQDGRLLTAARKAGLSDIVVSKP